MVEPAALKLGRLNFDRGQWLNAASYFEVFLQLHKEYENKQPYFVVCNLGQCYEEIGKLDQAAKVYDEFIKAYPNDPGVEIVKARLEKLRGIATK